MDVIVVPLLQMIHMIIHLYIWVIIAAVVLNWLTLFDVVNNYNRVVVILGDALFKLTEPLLAPLRGVLPHLGGLDLAPMVLILLLYFVESVIGMLIVKIVLSG
jgi:YggT family protein